MDSFTFALIKFHWDRVYCFYFKYWGPALCASVGLQDQPDAVLISSTFPTPQPLPKFEYKVPAVVRITS